MQQTVQLLGRVFFRAYVVAMLILIWDNKAFYGLPFGLLIGYLSEFNNLIELNKKKKDEKSNSDSPIHNIESKEKKTDEPPTFEIPHFDSKEKKVDEPPIFEIPDFNEAPKVIEYDFSDFFRTTAYQDAKSEIAKSDIEKLIESYDNKLIEKITSSLSESQLLRYNNYDTSKLILSDLKLYIDDIKKQEYLHIEINDLINKNIDKISKYEKGYNYAKLLMPLIKRGFRVDRKIVQKAKKETEKDLSKPPSSLKLIKNMSDMVLCLDELLLSSKDKNIKAPIEWINKWK